MKLLILTVSQYRGGAEEYTLKITRGAIAKGHTVEFAFPDTDGTQSLQHDLRELGVNYVPLDIGDDDTTWREYRKIIPLWRTFQQTRRMLKQTRPDAVLIAQPSLRCSLGPILACASLNIPALVVFQLVSSIFPLKSIEVLLYNWARKRRQSWIAISKNNRELAAKSFQCNPDVFHVVFNGVPVPSPLSTDEKQTIRDRIRAELNISDDTPLLLTVGRLHVQKGLTYLAEGLPNILKQHSNIQCVWAGDGPELDALQTQLRENGSLDAVQFLGHRTDITDLLHAADLFVFPTLWEGGQSFALAEAMAVSLPVVTTDASGIPEVITHKVHGLISPKKEADTFAHDVLYALDHPDKMKDMAQAAYERVQEFSEPKMVEQTLNILDDLLDKKS
ncbi:MAG: glycosyl transferase family 1 [Candidatus Hydrogenedentota bacterium]|nr:MAG: glycosyl transferase family 1 [Candidatus Hydrogenedentota bacterium]